MNQFYLPTVILEHELHIFFLQIDALLLTPVNKQANESAPIGIDGNDVLQKCSHNISFSSVLPLITL